jgi:NTP pyrophosphatase (non-canonical NTP hydrolase)
LVVGHQLVDVAFQFPKSEASPDLGSPRVAEEVVELAEAVVVAVERLGEVGAIFEVDQVEFLGQVRAG